MILIIDNNNDRGINISTILKGSKCIATQYEFVTGNTERISDWDNLKADFENLIGKNRILFIHKNNSRSEDAAKLFLKKSNSNQVILFSGGGNFTTQITSQNCFAFQGKVSDDAKTEWDLTGFASVLLSGNGNLIEALKGTDETLEKLLEQFEKESPYEATNKQGKILKDAKAELQTYVGKYLQKQSKS